MRAREQTCLKPRRLALILEVPLPDGSTAAVKGVAASVVDGRLERVIYTVEKQKGGWADVAGAETRGSHTENA